MLPFGHHFAFCVSAAWCLPFRAHVGAENAFSPCTSCYGFYRRLIMSAVGEGVEVSSLMERQIYVILEVNGKKKKMQVLEREGLLYCCAGCGYVNLLVGFGRRASLEASLGSYCCWPDGTCTRKESCIPFYGREPIGKSGNFAPRIVWGFTDRSDRM